MVTMAISGTQVKEEAITFRCGIALMELSDTDTWGTETQTTPAPMATPCLVTLMRESLLQGRVSSLGPAFTSLREYPGSLQAPLLPPQPQQLCETQKAC